MHRFLGCSLFFLTVAAAAALVGQQAAPAQVIAARSAIFRGVAFTAQQQAKQAKDPQKDKDAKKTPEPEPADPRVNQAIERGVKFLKKLQEKDGTWKSDYLGSTIIAAWTLLECGVSPNDPMLQKAIDHVRGVILNVEKTYEISLALMMFDRLADPEDEPLIEVLALRLLAGQQDTRNGWTYSCPALPQAEVARVETILAKLKKDGPRKLPEEPKERKPRDPKLVTQSVMRLALDVVYNPPQTNMPDSSDNSNTQFAMLALWVARRHGMPVDLALVRTEARFRKFQQVSGGWGYLCTNPNPLDKSSPSNPPTATMTCCGLIAIALGNAATRPKGSLPANLTLDPQVKNALYLVSVTIGDASGKPTPGDVPLGDRSSVFYHLWTLERMAVLYNFKTIGGKDWYKWGADFLIADQGSDGGWSARHGAGGIDTCFALLFLRRVNVAKEVTLKIGNKVKDPGKVPDKLLDLIGRELKSGGDMQKDGSKTDQKKDQPNSKKQNPSAMRRLPASVPATLRQDELLLAWHSAELHCRGSADDPNGRW
jgi:hypothetical protein